MVRGAAIFVRAPRCAVKPTWRSAARLGIGTLFSSVLLVSLMAFVDELTIQYVKTLPRWSVDAFQAVTDFGRSGWILIPVGCVLVAIAMRATPTLPRIPQLVLTTVVVRLGFLFLAVGVPGLFVTIVKRLIGRARPIVGDHTDPFLFKSFVWQPAYASFPSGHATTAFAALVAIGMIWPRLGPFMWAYALIIAASRVVTLQHYPSDVVAGALVGVVGAWLVRDWFATRRLGFVCATGGGVRVLPGPSFERIRKLFVDLAHSEKFAKAQSQR